MAAINEVCTCGHVADEHESHGFQRCTIPECKCVAFDLDYDEQDSQCSSGGQHEDDGEGTCLGCGESMK